MINILPDLKICQEAKGIVKDSKFVWVCNPWAFSDKSRWMILLRKEAEDPNRNGIERITPAPLTDEILKMLPKFFKKDGDAGIVYLIIECNDNCYVVYYGHYEHVEKHFFTINEKLSNALLLLAIKLVEEGLLK
jgi:hypothetical protein